MRNLHIIVFLFLLILPCCRSRKVAVETASRDLWQEINLEMRHLDSVSLQDEHFSRIEIEYYYPCQDSAFVTCGQERDGIAKRVVVETGQKSQLTRCVTDSVSAREKIEESDFKSVETKKEKPNNLPLSVAICLLIAAGCSFLLYIKRRK